MSSSQSKLLDSLYHPATLHVNNQGCIDHWEGDPAYYGLTPASLNGTAATDHLPCLFGLPEDEAHCLNFVNLGDNLSTDIHVQPHATGYTVLIMDVTRLRDSTQQSQQASNELGLLYQRLEQLSQELGERNQQLKEANRTKSLFISSMSHEFRTPMISILGHLDWQKRELPDNPSILRSSRSIERSARYLLSLVDNLLNQGKLEAGSMEIHPQATHLPEFFEHLLDAIQPLSSDKGLRLLNDLDDLPNTPVDIDEYHLHQVLLNLLTNAVKYTPSGQINLAASYNGRELTVVVADEGIGIPAEALETLFVPFSRASNSEIAQGAGLGLSIAKKIVEMMAGKMDIESTPRMGTNVTLTLPAPLSAGEIDLIEADIHDQPELKACVYVMDDNPDILEIYQLFLAEAGIDNRMFSHPETFLNAILKDEPELVITDYQLGQITGIDLTRKLRSEGYSGRIIMLTATTTIESTLLAQAEQAGCDLFMPKPMDVNRLVDMIRTQVAEHE